MARGRWSWAVYAWGLFVASVQMQSASDSNVRFDPLALSSPV
jgi:hypothetical protein